MAVADIYRQRARVAVPPAAIHQVMRDFLAVIATAPGR